MRSTVILLFYNKTSLFPFNDFKQIYLFIAAVFPYTVISFSC